MRFQLISRLISTVCALGVMACGATSVSEVASPDVVRCATSVGSPIPTVPSAGGRVPVTITAPRECSWTASSDSSWMQVSPTSGQGEAGVTLDVGANTVANPRTATLIVNNQRFSVPQEAAPCHYSLSSTSASFDANGGQTTVRVSSPSACSWTASAQDSWVHVQMTSGSGEATIGLSVDRNTGAARSAQLTVAGQMFTVSQAAYVPAPAPAPPPVPSPSPSPSPTPSPAPSLCTYSLSSYNKDFGGKGGDGSFKVITPDGCPWSAVSTADWIALTSGASGAGPGEVKYHVDQNRSKDPRIGTISVAGQVYSVTQKGS